MANKFMDGFFEFPIKIYDGFSLQVAERQEDSMGTRVEADWIIGMARLPGNALPEMMWYEAFSRDKTVEDAEENGFDVTIIRTKNHGEFMCPWRRKELEDRLEAFIGRQQNGNVG